MKKPNKNNRQNQINRQNQLVRQERLRREKEKEKLKKDPFLSISVTNWDKSGSIRMSDLISMANEGVPEAQFAIADCMTKGVVFPPELGDAMSWYIKSGEGGCAQAQKILGIFFVNKDSGGTIRDPVEARKWFKLAAENGDAYSMSAYAYLLESGIGGEKDSAEALRLIKIAFEKGDPRAIFFMAGLKDPWLNIDKGIGETIPKDFEESEKLYRMSAEKGLAESQSELGVLLIWHKESTPEEKAEGVEWLIKASDQGLIDADFKLGCSYCFGLGITQDQEKAFQLFKKAADAGHKQSCYHAAVHYHLGEGTQKDPSEAIKYFQRSAENYYPIGMREFGKIIIDDKPVLTNYVVAEDLFQGAAEKGDNTSYFFLGLMSRQGLGRPRDLQKAEEYLQKAADLGVSIAEHWFGLSCLNKEEEQKDYEKASEWFLKAADNNFAPSQYALGVIYGRGLAEPKGEKSAIEWLHLAAKRHFPDAYLELGKHYSEGKIVPIDMEKAKEFFQKSEEFGLSLATDVPGILSGKMFPPFKTEPYDWEAIALLKDEYDELSFVAWSLEMICDDPENDARSLEEDLKDAELGSSNAQFRVGVAYSIGNESQRDYKKAYEWYKKAADQGHEMAMYNLSVMFLTGQGVEEDEKMGIMYLGMASRKKLGIASEQLGFRYWKGLGVPKNIEKAARMFRKAAEQGFPASQFCLAVMLIFADGIPQDHNEGMMWLQKSSRQGYPSAIKLFNKVQGSS
jgi:TPR repeat protein